jgi:hypothetical protein
MDGSQSFSAQNVTTSDEYTFEELPDPQLYDIDESDFISHILEQKLSGGDQTNPKLSISFWDYKKMYDPRQIGELLPEYHRRGNWIGLSPVTGQYKLLHNIPGDDVSTGKAMFNGCMDATLWYKWNLWPRMSNITVYPTEFALLTSDIPDIQNHLKQMRSANPTWEIFIE